MSTNVVARLIVKDLYMNRWLIAVSLLVGIASILASGIGKLAFGVGMIFYLTTIVAFGVMLVMYGVVQERKDKCLLFVLSLPVSNEQYLKSKVLAVLATFLVVWGSLTLTGVILLIVTAAADGFVPFFVASSAFLLMNFCLILAMALLTTNEIAIVCTIILTNLSVSLFFMLTAAIPSIHDHMEGNVMVWSKELFTILVTEVAVMLIALTVPLYVRRGGRALI